MTNHMLSDIIEFLDSITIVLSMIEFVILGWMLWRVEEMNDDIDDIQEDLDNDLD